jgi:DNA repair protein RecO (recombination protein O)
MGLHETEAIILRTYNLAEADKIVVCLTRSSGVVRAVARGAKRLKSRFGAGLEPFTIINLTYYEKEGRELVTLQQAEIIRSFFGLAKTTEAVTAMSYMSELVLEFAPPHEPNEKIFRMVRAVLEALSQTPEDLTSLIRYFEVWILKLSGFLPELRFCTDCGKKFDTAAPIYFNSEFKVSCKDCSHTPGRELSATAHRHLRAAQHLSPADFTVGAKELAEPQKNEMAGLTQSLIIRALERRPRSQASFN